MKIPITTVVVRYENDIVLARQRARQIGALLGFPTRDQVRIATALSEIVRNAFAYAGGGKVDFIVRTEQTPQVFEIRVTDGGPGIPHLNQILDGTYVSRTGLGMGILGARRLMDDFTIQSSPGSGTTVTLAKVLPRSTTTLTPEKVMAATEALSHERPGGHIEELQSQNQELLSTLDELQRRQVELAQLNRELEDTNRGVVALYAELDERADYLRRVSESKTQFLSNMTHEFRTPVNSILSLCRILQDRMDGDLTGEQERQVKLIEGAAHDLSEIINDLLDLAKAEAGRTTLHPMEFSVESLFGALRGMLRPLLAHNSSVSLVFEEPSATPIPPLFTDESKVSQILRNLVSNALKFTESGEVRVTAAAEPDDFVTFRVTDTGIGIEEKDQERIFEEFTQVEGRHQIGKKGTGLGLPLSRKLAELLGGSLTVRSQAGLGSTFVLRVPSVYRGPVEVSMVPELPTDVDPLRYPVLVIEDNRETMFVYEKYLKGSGFQALPARTLKQAREVLTRCRPVAIILDILLAHENTWNFLGELTTSPLTRDIPVFVLTVVENREKALALGARDFQPKPADRTWLLDRLRAAAPSGKPEEILIVDDEEASRTALRVLLGDTRFRTLEAPGGREALRLARDRKPAAVLLDFGMPDMDGREVVRQLRADPVTAGLPVVIHTGKSLTEEERLYFDSQCTPVVGKIEVDRTESMRRIREALAKAGLGQDSKVCHPA